MSSLIAPVAILAQDRFARVLLTPALVVKILAWPSCRQPASGIQGMADIEIPQDLESLDKCELINLIRSLEQERPRGRKRSAIPV